MTEDTTDIVDVEPQTTKAVANLGDCLPVSSVRQQVQQIQHLMAEVMQEGSHYGKIPGCGDKPTLLQPGAQKLSLTFRLAPKVVNEHAENLTGGHREYSMTVVAIHRPSGQHVADGVGTCTTMESRYRFRSHMRATGDPIPSDYTQRKGYYKSQGLTCSKIDGEWAWCRIERGENDNPADYFNTCRKIAFKRAWVHAIINATAASDIFTQDIEDDPSIFGGSAPSGNSSLPRDSTDRPGPTTTRADPPPRQTAQSQVDDTTPTGDGLTWIEDVKKFDGTSKAGKPYTKFIITTRNGDRLSTFRSTDADVADESVNRGVPVRIVSVRNQYGLNLESIEIVEDVSGATADDAPEQNSDVQCVVEDTIEKVEGRMMNVDGQAMMVWTIVGGKARYGTLDKDVAAVCQEVAGNSAQRIVLTYEDTSRGKKIVKAENDIPF